MSIDTEILINQIKDEFQVKGVQEQDILVLAYGDELEVESKAYKKTQKKLCKAYEIIAEHDAENILNFDFGKEIYFSNDLNNLKSIIDKKFKKYINYYWDWIETKDQQKVLELIFDDLH